MHRAILTCSQVVWRVPHVDFLLASIFDAARMHKMLYELNGVEPTSQPGELAELDKVGA